jgi:hypothetical protein
MGKGESSHPLSKKAITLIIGITVGVVAVVALTILIIVLLTKRSVTSSYPSDIVNENGYLLGSFSYYNANFSGSPWTANDFTVTVNGTMIPWQNMMLTDGYASWPFYANVWDQVYQRTGVKLLIFWKGDQMNTVSDVNTFRSQYMAIKVSYPSLPSEPQGIFLYDEPSPDMILGNGSFSSLVAISSAIRSAYPRAKQWANFRYDSINNRTDLCTAIGSSQLDYISSDEYYDVSVATYQATYQTYLYPNLKPNQKILLTPFAAYMEGSTPNTTISATAADSDELTTSPASATKYYSWMMQDPKVHGLIVYRLKNLWWNGTGDILSNPNGTGLGLVDVQTNGTYVTPQTVAFYQALGTSWYQSSAFVRVE